MPKEETMVMTGARVIAPSVHEFTFRRENGEPLSWIAGQFMMLHFEDEQGTFNRSYSISTIPSPDATEMGFAISQVADGRGTGILFRLKPGETVKASGPFGRFILRPGEQPKRLLLVATGTGVAPYRSMLPELCALADGGTDVHVLMGVRCPEDLFFGDEFRMAAADTENFTFHASYSREMREEPLPDEHSGYVQAVMEHLEPDPEQDIVYLCGNPAMIDEALERLQEQGFLARHIRREKYISPGS